MADGCPYCGKTWVELGIVPGPRRYKCDDPECLLMHRRLRAGKSATEDASIGNPIRTWGQLTIPSKQDRLNLAMRGQLMYCPNCGSEHLVPVDQRLECLKCKSVWTISWGAKSNGDVCVARMDRWS